jgi:hypothetical protein
VSIRSICWPGRCLAVELKIRLPIRSPYWAALEAQSMSTCPARLLRTLPQSLPRPSPRRLLRRLHRASQRSVFPSHESLRDCAKHISIRSRQSLFCYGWLNPLSRSDLALSFNESLVFRVVSNPEPNHGISVRDAKRSIVVRDTG